MTRCELCSRRLGRSEVVHTIQYGVIEDSSGMFLPARESAPTVICLACEAVILERVYSRLKPTPCFRRP